MNSIAFYREKFVAYLQDNIKRREPHNLYDPMVYILNLGGKRLRPVSVLMSAELFSAPYTKALDAALAVEIFHNFSLVHDDIMDDAPVRRGKESVHEKWNTNTAILSGDAMLINAYQLFENYENATFRDLAELFTKTAIQVCEGQQLDVDYEEFEEIRLEQYLKMVEYKTAVLVGASMQMGAIVAGADVESRDKIYEYGRLLGLAFQIKDDYLDVFGDYRRFGKQIGGDIIENKKTFLYLKTLEVAPPKDKQELKYLYSVHPNEVEQKIEAVTHIFEKSGVVSLTEEKIKAYTEEAFALLDQLPLKENRKTVFREFGKNLMNRQT